MRGTLDTHGSSTIIMHPLTPCITGPTTTGNHPSPLEQLGNSWLEGTSTGVHDEGPEHDPVDTTGSASAKGETNTPKFPWKIEHSSTTIRSASAGSGLTFATSHSSSFGRLDLAVNKTITSQQETSIDILSPNGDEPMERILTSETTNLDPLHNASSSSSPSLLLLCELEKYRYGPVHDDHQNRESRRLVPVSVQINRPRTLVSHFKMLRITDDHGTKATERQVSFHQVTIRRYPMIAGDNPACENGPPVTLDWSFEELPSLDLDDFESMRRRTRRQKLHHLLLSYVQRQRILFGIGYTEQEVLQVEKEARTARFQRHMTTLSLPISRIEEMIQSMRRKFQRQWKPTERQSKLEFNALMSKLLEEDAKRLSPSSSSCSTTTPP